MLAEKGIGEAEIVEHVMLVAEPRGKACRFLQIVQILLGIARNAGLLRAPVIERGQRSPVRAGRRFLLRVPSGLFDCREIAWLLRVDLCHHVVDGLGRRHEGLAFECRGDLFGLLERQRGRAFRLTSGQGKNREDGKQ